MLMHKAAESAALLADLCPPKWRTVWQIGPRNQWQAYLTSVTN